MANVVVDARGRSCPEPVLMTMQSMGKNSQFEVLVDNKVAVENIMRCCNSKGFNLEMVEEGLDYRLKLKRK